MGFGAGDPTRQLFLGDMLLVGCCIFYLLWWILAFKPNGAVKGLPSSWLLLPALVLGILAVYLLVCGAAGADVSRSFFPAKAVLLVAIIVYVALLVLTRFILHRQVTTELLLIIGWAALVFLESNVLYGLEIIGRSGALGFFAAAAIATAVSMLCYIRYYDLKGWAAYVDGMIPLLLAAAFMAVLAWKLKA